MAKRPTLKKNSKPNPNAKSRKLTNEQLSDKMEDVVKCHLNQLSEWFDSVYIIGSKPIPNGMITISLGKGDIHAIRSILQITLADIDKQLYGQ